MLFDVNELTVKICATSLREEFAPLAFSWVLGYYEGEG
jgi:hypothetical protein